MSNNYKLVLILFLVLNAMLVNLGISFSQDVKTIEGIVLNAETHEPVTFVNVSVLNIARGTATDVNGFFKITVEKDKNIKLVFSHINFFKKEILLRDSTFSSPLTIYLTPKTERLHDVVVSASLYEQPLEKLSKPAAIISHRDIVDNMQSNLVDVLAQTPGFTQVWEYHSPVLLRGLNSNRIVIMQDGDRRIGTFPGGYFGQDLNIYDNKKVEIIKGPGSVIYGSGAISGIINIIGNDIFGPDDTNVKILSGYGSNNNEFLELARICFKKEKFGLSLNGKYRKTDDYEYGNGETADNSDVEDHDLSLRAGYKFSEKHKIVLKSNYHDGDWGKPRGFNGPAKRFTKIRNDEHNIHSSVNYTYSPGGMIEAIKLNAYYDYGKRDYYQYKYSTVTNELSSLDLVHYKNHYGGGQLFGILNLSAKNKLTAGIDGYLFRLDNPSDIIDYYNNTKGTNEGYKNAGQKNAGVFVNNEWYMTNQLKLISGIRFDMASVDEGKNAGQNGRDENREAWSGNAGLVYSPTTETHISVNLGRAFRMPSAEELFTKVISCKGIKIGNPDLQAEYSWNLDLGMRGRAAGHKLKYDLALFYNELEDFINETPAPDNTGADFTYQNTDARIIGGEVSASYNFKNVFRPSNNLYAGLGGAYVHGTDKSGDNDEPLFGMPPLKISCELNYRGKVNKRWLTGYNMKINTEYAAEQNRVASVPEGTDGGPWGYVPSGSHTVFNFAMGLNSNSLTGSPKIRFIVKNIFDTDYKPFGSYIPVMGRNCKFLLSFSF